MESDNIQHSARMARRATEVAILFALLVFSACEDRLPTRWVVGPADPDSLGDNAFVLDGNGYNAGVFNLSPRNARAYYFSEDTITSILNADLVIDPYGKSTNVVVHITVPGNMSDSYEWANALNWPVAKSKVRIAIDDDEYVSIRGSTQVYFISDVTSRLVRGSYSGILQNGAGKQVILSEGRFNGSFF